MILFFMYLDALLLALTSFALVAIAYEHHALPRILKVALLFAAYFAGSHAYWLLGRWVPSVAGYPAMRLGEDAAIAFVAVYFAAIVLVRKREREREVSR